jgi:hypothetical protein
MVTEKEIRMVESDTAGWRFQVPVAVEEELRATGHVGSAGDATKGAGADVGMIVLTVYNTAASTTTLFQTPGVIHALAVSLTNWFRRDQNRAP